MPGSTVSPSTPASTGAAIAAANGQPILSGRPVGVTPAGTTMQVGGGVGTATLVDGQWVQGGDTAFNDSNAAPTSLTLPSTSLTNASPLDFTTALNQAQGAHTPLDTGTINNIKSNVQAEYAPLVKAQQGINANENAINKAREAAGGDAGFGQSQLGQQAGANVQQYGQTQLTDLANKETAEINSDTTAAQNQNFDQQSTEFQEAQSLVQNSQTQIQSQIDNYYKAQGLQNTMTDNARQTLNTILTQFGGTAFSELTDDEQKSLTNFANQVDPSGALAAILPKGMDTIAQQRLATTQAQNDADNQIKMMQLSIAQQNADTAAERATVEDSIAQMRLQIAQNSSGNFPSTAQEDISNTINLLNNKYKGADGYVNTAAYSQALSELLAKYPQYTSQINSALPATIYLNPKDKTAAGLLKKQ